MLAGAPPPPPAGDGEPEPGEPGAALLLLLDQDRVPVPTSHSFQPGLDMSAMFDNYFQNYKYKANIQIRLAEIDSPLVNNSAQKQNFLLSTC